MSAPAPHRPLPIKVMNTVGGLAARVGLKPSLTPESIMAAAAKKTGLDDFGPDTFRPGLDALCWSLEHEAELHTLGRIAARASLLGRMEARLQLIDWRKKHPEVFEEKLEKPIFVLGLPRTGTTVLYGLLAANPALRDPVTWEVNSPVRHRARMTPQPVTRGSRCRARRWPGCGNWPRRWTRSTRWGRCCPRNASPCTCRSSTPTRPW